MAFSFFRKPKEEEQASSKWRNLVSMDDLDSVVKASFSKPQLIFKHSTRCGISRTVLRQFESEWKSDSQGDLHFLDLIQFRSISNEIAHRFGVEHQSPQVIIIDKGLAISDASHQAISAEYFEPKMK